MVSEFANKQARTVTDINGHSHTEQCYYALDGTGVEHPSRPGKPTRNYLITLTQWEIGWLAWA